MPPTSSAWTKSHLTYFLPRILGLIAFLALLTHLWTNSRRPATVHYTPSAPSLPEEVKAPLSVGTGTAAVYGALTNSGKTHADAAEQAIISPAMKAQNMSWLYDNFGKEWEINLYVVDDPTANNSVVKNKGREAGVYLTYIIQHYHALPHTMTFLHGRRYEWHNDDPMYDGVPILNRLNTTYVQKTGYTSLRCAWTPGCPSFIYPSASNATHESYAGEYLYAQTFAEWFPDTPVPEAVGSYCCAQFAVSREKVLERPLEDYVKFRDWVFAAKETSSNIGFVMEYMWHVIFGQPVLNCAVSAQQCYCEKFGLCELDCKERGRCEGMYWIPPGYYLGLARLPEGWPEKGQGGAWPEEGWDQKLRPDLNETMSERVKERERKLMLEQDGKKEEGEGEEKAEEASNDAVV